MLRFILTFFSIFNGIHSLSLNSTYMDKYNQYIQDYEKDFDYDNFIIFKNNLKFIENHNKNNNSYELEINYFSDQKISSNTHYIQNKKLEGKDPYPLNNSIIVPLSIDWREKDVVTDVKNQGNCGSCWSFSATGSIEGINAITNGILLNISEQELVDCSSNYGNNGCEGGSMDNAFKYVIKNGLCSEKDYPYTANDGNCQKCNSIVNITGYQDITSNNEKALKRVVSQQPVSVAIQANTRSFQMYSNGIYSDLTCGNQLDHGVLIVGYGYDLLYNMDYWIVKNSWGPNWGENGYIRMQRNIQDSTGICGIAMQPTIPTINLLN